MARIASAKSMTSTALIAVASFDLPLTMARVYRARASPRKRATHHEAPMHFTNGSAHYSPGICEITPSHGLLAEA